MILDRNTVITSVGGVELAGVRVDRSQLLHRRRTLSAIICIGRFSIRAFIRRSSQSGAGSWLGAGVIVLTACLSVRDIVGAGSVVTRDLPDYAVAVGVPAQVKQLRSQ